MKGVRKYSSQALLCSLFLLSSVGPVLAAEDSQSATNLEPITVTATRT